MPDTGQGRASVVPGRLVLVACGVRCSYGGHDVLRGVDLGVEQGTFHGLVAPAGAGKTVLMETLAGRRRADAGTVEVLGQPPLPRDPRLLARMGVQPRVPAFFPRATVWEHLMTTAALFGASAARTEQVRDAFGLAPARRTRVEGLDVQQRQRLAVASALLHRPEILLLDEPAAGLDDSGRSGLVSALAAVREEETTVLYATRHVQDAQHLCDTVSVLDAGRVVATAPPSALMAGTVGTAGGSLVDSLTHLTGKEYEP